MHFTAVRSIIMDVQWVSANFGNREVKAVINHIPVLLGSGMLIGVRNAPPTYCDGHFVVTGEVVHYWCRHKARPEDQGAFGGV